MLEDLDWTSSTIAKITDGEITAMRAFRGVGSMLRNGPPYLIAIESPKDNRNTLKTKRAMSMKNLQQLEKPNDP
jgi:hypothetical protein